MDTDTKYERSCSGRARRGDEASQAVHDVPQLRQKSGNRLDQGHGGKNQIWRASTDTVVEAVQFRQQDDQVPRRASSPHGQTVALGEAEAGGPHHLLEEGGHEQTDQGAHPGHHEQQTTLA